MVHVARSGYAQSLTMNTFEFWAFLGVWLSYSLYLWIVLRNDTAAIRMLVIGLCAIPLYFSIRENTQLMTIDEWGFINEPLYMTNGNRLVLWWHAAFRTSNAILGTVAAAHHKFVPWFTEHQSYALLKATHWITAAFTVLAAHFALVRYVIPNKQKAGFSLVFFYGIFLLPAVNIAFKTATYDKLYVAFSILGIALILAGLWQKNIWLLYASVIAGYLATQDKVLASPVLMIAIFTCGLHPFLTDYGRSTLKNIRQSLVHISGASILSVFVGLIGALMTARVQHFNEWPLAMFAKPIEPHLVWAFLLGLLRGADSVSPWADPAGFVSFVYVEFNPLQLIGLFTITLLGIWILASTTGWIGQQAWFDAIKKTVLGQRGITVTSLIFAAAMLFGVVGVFTATAYFDFAGTIAEGGYYVPIVTMDPGAGEDKLLHFFSTSYFGHLWAQFQFYLTFFVLDIPIVVWALLIATIVFYPRWQSHVNDISKSAFLIGLLLAVALMFVFAVANFRVEKRYVNLQVILVVLPVLVFGMVMLAQITSRQTGLLLSIAFALLMAAETVPFEPLGTAYRPIWTNLNLTHLRNTDPAYMVPAWPSWGENMMIVGKRLQAKCDAGTADFDCTDVNLFSAITGLWVTDESDITRRFAYQTNPDEYRYTANDFYIIPYGRISEFEGLPAGIEPYDTVTYRGLTAAWVYRGDDLASIGFLFEE